MIDQRIAQVVVIDGVELALNEYGRVMAMGFPVPGLREMTKPEVAAFLASLTVEITRRLEERDRAARN